LPSAAPAAATAAAPATATPATPPPAKEKFNLIEFFGLKKSAAAPKKTANKAATCDLCTDLNMPSCVYACPHDAAMRVDPSEFFANRLVGRQLTPTSFQQVKRFDPRTTHKATMRKGDE
jgi:Fe-S-cluster-containing hydrogenase component 2